jgi:hypothetical protein
MAEYRIVCTRRVGASKGTMGHSHITHVGTGAANFSRLWTVAEVFDAMAKGTTFHTVGRKSGKTAQVLRQECQYCIEETLRSTADAVEDNNIDRLPTCE